MISLRMRVQKKKRPRTEPWDMPKFRSEGNRKKLVRLIEKEEPIKYEIQEGVVSRKPTKEIVSRKINQIVNLCQMLLIDQAK